MPSLWWQIIIKIFIMIPKENTKDVKEIPAKILKEVEIVFVENMDDVLKNALVVDDPEKLFSKLVEAADDVLVPAETPKSSEEIVTHWPAMRFDNRADQMTRRSAVRLLGAFHFDI